MPQSNIEIRELTNADAEAMARFYAATWGGSGDADAVREARRRDARTNPYRPGEAPSAWGMLRDGELVGYIGTLPNAFWINDQELTACWFKGFMVAEAYRDGPVGYSVLKQAARETAAAGALVVAPAAYKLFEAVGFRDLGPVTDYVVPLREAPLLQKLDLEAFGERFHRPGFRIPVGIAKLPLLRHLAGWSMRLARRLMVAFAAPRDRGVEITMAADPGALDDVWRHCRAELHASPVRHGDFMRWRYLDRPGYELLLASKAGAAVGLVVLRSEFQESDERLKGIRVAVLEELLFAPSQPEVGAALLLAAQRWAYRQGAELLLASASHRCVRRLLPRCGFIPVGGSMHFLIKAVPDSGVRVGELDAWWIMRGDAHSDATY